MEKIKWSEKETNEQVPDCIGEKRTHILHILRRNCLLHDAIEGQMAEVKGVGRSSLVISQTEENTGS